MHMWPSQSSDQEFASVLASPLEIYAKSQLQVPKLISGYTANIFLEIILHVTHAMTDAQTAWFLSRQHILIANG